MIRFLELKLEQLSNPTSEALLDSLKVWYHDRKNPILISALKFLIQLVQPRNTTRPYQFPACTTLTNFLKTEYSRLYPAVAEEEPEEEAYSTSTSPTDMTAAFQEFMTAE